MMDVRKIFRVSSDQLMSEFEASAEIQHSGGKGSVREDALNDLLVERLPKRYSVGRGEVINSENYTSGQLDLVIHDPFSCPVIVSSPSHSVFPIESVFGVISIKSSLGSQELRDAYQNIGSFMEVVDRDGFTTGGNGFQAGMHFPRPITGVFAFKADRSLDAIAKQMKELDGKLNSLKDRPDFVCVLGVGIVGPMSAVRNGFNEFSPPSEEHQLYAIRRAGRHTLFQLYIQILRELSTLTLRPLSLRFYENMPELIGDHRVRGHNNFAFTQPNGERPIYASRLTKVAIDLIVANAAEMTLSESLRVRVGAVPADMSEQEAGMKVYCYNPENLPPIDSDYIRDVRQNKTPRHRVFQPLLIQIDRKEYIVELTSLPPEAFTTNYDLTYDEMMSR